MKIAKREKFIALSGTGWLIDLSILVTLTYLLIEPFYANFISSSVAASLVFMLSRKFIFDAKHQTPHSELIIYIMYTAIIIMLASWLIQPVIQLLQHTADYLTLDLTTETIVFLAKVFITPPQLILNYVVSKLIIERKAHAV